MMKRFKNWKTTLAGLIPVVVKVAAPNIDSQTADAITLLSIAVIGFFAKDAGSDVKADETAKSEPVQQDLDLK